jgi:CRP-like cAMP-binding protein
MPRFDPATVSELNRVGLLSELPGDTLTKLAARMERQEIAPGQPVLLEGEEGNHFYCVLTGVLAVSNQGGLAPRRVLRPGDYFGEVALVMDVPRTASVTALTAVTVASCDRETFDEFVKPLFADAG